MTDEVNLNEGEMQEPLDEKSSRERSSIAFPYVDLEDAVSVANAMHTKTGETCTLAQLAAAMNHDSIESGAFRVKVSAARIFGLIKVDRKSIQVTDLGRQIVDPQGERAARAEAFLQVPLYRRIFDKYTGYQLPSDTALEAVFVSLGVSEKQKSRARQTFQRSAAFAGYLPNGKDRLVAPSLKSLSTVPSGSAIDPESHRDRDALTQYSTKNSSKKHPLIEALFTTVPEEGLSWDSDSREKWLSTAKSIFDLVYQT